MHLLGSKPWRGTSISIKSSNLVFSSRSPVHPHSTSDTWQLLNHNRRVFWSKKLWRYLSSKNYLIPKDFFRVGQDSTTTNRIQMQSKSPPYGSFQILQGTCRLRPKAAASSGARWAVEILWLQCLFSELQTNMDRREAWSVSKFNLSMLADQINLLVPVTHFKYALICKCKVKREFQNYQNSHSSAAKHPQRGEQENKSRIGQVHLQTKKSSALSKCHFISKPKSS